MDSKHFVTTGASVTGQESQRLAMLGLLASDIMVEDFMQEMIVDWLKTLVDSSQLVYCLP